MRVMAAMREELHGFASCPRAITGRNKDGPLRKSSAFVEKTEKPARYAVRASFEKRTRLSVFSSAYVLGAFGGSSERNAPKNPSPFAVSVRKLGTVSDCSFSFRFCSSPCFLSFFGLCFCRRTSRSASRFAIVTSPNTRAMSSGAAYWHHRRIRSASMSRSLKSTLSPPCSRVSPVVTLRAETAFPPSRRKTDFGVLQPSAFMQNGRGTGMSVFCGHPPSVFLPGSLKTSGFRASGPRPDFLRTPRQETSEKNPDFRRLSNSRRVLST